MVRLMVIDEGETIDFVAPPHVIKMAVACCTRRPESARGLIGELGQYDPAFSARVTAALAGDTAEADTLGMVVTAPGEDRGEGHDPAGADVVMINLPARRIVQIGNRSGTIERTDRGRMRRNGRPVQVFYTYTLPDEWRIVP